MKMKKHIGRKPSEDPKQRIYLYVKRSEIDQNGGEEELKTHLYQRISARAKNKK